VSRRRKRRAGAGVGRRCGDVPGEGDGQHIQVLRRVAAKRADAQSRDTRMRYWLMKSEPDEFSIDDLAAAPRQTTAWFGVRNYQARNFMRDGMGVGEGVLSY